MIFTWAEQRSRRRNTNVPINNLNRRCTATLSFILDRVAGHSQSPSLVEIAALCPGLARIVANVPALPEVRRVKVTPGQAGRPGGRECERTTAPVECPLLAALLRNLRDGGSEARPVFL